MVFLEPIMYVVEHPSIIGVVFLLYCFIYALSLLFSGPKPGRNPFSIKHVRSPPELVVDKAVRKAVLKQRFRSMKVPERVDDIIIGSGIGALATAVMLGRAGHKVLVLEQHDRAGGCTHTFKDKGFEFDTGIHYVGKMTDGDMIRVLIDQITEGQVQWVPMDAVYDIVAIGPSYKAKHYSIMSGKPEDFAKNLEKQFPEEKKAIEKLMSLLKACAGKTLMGLVMPKMLPLPLAKLFVKTGLYHLVYRQYARLSSMTVKQVLDEVSDNDDFKGSCSYIFGDIGMAPGDLSFFGYALLMNHYMSGAFYTLGGTSEIAFRIIPIIESHGGRVFVDAPVTKILVNEKGRANGVTVHKSGGDVNIYAKRIISDAGVANTMKYLLPTEIAQKTTLYSVMDKMGPSISNLTVFIGLSGSSEELGLIAGNTWALSDGDIDKELKNYMSLSVEEAAESECPLMFISFPSAKDPAYHDRHPGKAVALVITLTPWSWFSKWKDGRVNHRGDDYNAIKEKFGQQMWKQTEELFPNLAGKMEYMDVGTPVSNRYYLGQPEGDMYGLNHSLPRFTPEVSMHLRPDSGIPGLYLTGQDIFTCGFAASLMSATLTSSAILHRNLMNDLTAVVKETRKQIKKEKSE